jgi:hypothetical protein
MSKSFLITILFALSLIAVVNAQDYTKAEDTLEVVTLQKIRVPEIPLVLSAITIVNAIDAEILDASGTSILKLSDKQKFQKPLSEEIAAKVSAQKGRGITVQSYFEPTFNEPGVFYLKLSINVIGEASKALVATKYYLINVKLPTLAAPITVRSAYYFSESPAFSFATREFTHQELYSYKVTGCANPKEGKGSFIDLKDLFNDAANVNRTLKVEGFYNDAIMKYADPATGEAKVASWDIRIDRPNLGEFNSWKKITNKPEDDDVPYYMYVDSDPKNVASRQFLFGCFGNTSTGFVFVAPTFNNLSVSSDPEGFLVQGQTFTKTKNGSFSVIQLNVNPEFLGAMAVGSDQAVKVTIKFKNQFGEDWNKIYRANVVK